MSNFGKIVVKMLWENKLCQNAVPDAVILFGHYASCNEIGEVVYVRLLLNLLGKRIHSNFILDQFTKAASIHSVAG